MAYSEFSLADLQRKFHLVIKETGSTFDQVLEVDLPFLSAIF